MIFQTSFIFDKCSEEGGTACKVLWDKNHKISFFRQCVHCLQSQPFNFCCKQVDTKQLASRKVTKNNTTVNICTWSLSRIQMLTTTEEKKENIGQNIYSAEERSSYQSTYKY